MPNYVVSVGVGAIPIYGGRNPPAPSFPAWVTAKPLNEWFEITNTANAGSAAVDAYSGFSFKHSTGEIIIAAAGGHLNSSDNRVVSLNIYDDVPGAWVQRHDPTPVGQVTANSPYNADGLPASRHLRYQCIYQPNLDRVMLIGSPSLYGGGVVSSVESNGFDLATNTWDAAGTWTSTASGGTYGAAVDDAGNIWCRGQQKWLWSTDTFAAMPISVRAPLAFDPVRRQLFGLYLGDGQGFNPELGIIAKTISEDLATTQTITFNASAAWTEFQALAMAYCAMTYDSIGDRFLYYYGYGTSQGKIYVVTPNSGTAWDMSILAQGAGTILPVTPPTDNSGIQNRFQYIPALKGVLMLARKSANLYFMRLSN